MHNDQYVAHTGQSSALAMNKVLKNTYLLLSMTLVFSSVCAFFGMVSGVSPMISMVSSIAALGLIWLVLPKTANSSAGIPTLFAITGLLGFGLGPTLNYYMSFNPGIIMTALAGTGVIFLSLSGYALTTKKDFSFMAGFLMVGMFVAIGASLLNIFLGIPALSLAVSAGIIVIMSGFILYETSSVIRGGETNYIMAAASLFLSILNLFTSLLHILGVFGGDD
jgi:modulator of FtsH protease